MKYKWENIADKKTYDNFLLTQPRSYFIQSWNHGLSKEKTGLKIIRRGLRADGDLKVVYTATLEKFRLGSRLNIMSGPVGTNSDVGLIKLFTEEIEYQARLQGAVFVKIRPCENDNKENRETYKKLKWIKSPISVAHLQGGDRLRKK